MVSPYLSPGRQLEAWGYRNIGVRERKEEKQKKRRKEEEEEEEEKERKRRRWKRKKKKEEMEGGRERCKGERTTEEGHTDRG